VGREYACPGVSIGSVRKELHPGHEGVACDVCGRTILKGERVEPFLAPGGQRYSVCALCFRRAEHGGWIRESVAGDTPARTTRPEPRRPLFGRLRRRLAGGRQPASAAEAGGNGAVAADAEPPGAEAGVHPDAVPSEPFNPAPEPTRAPPRTDTRHVRAVPTTAEVKVERALELFNASEQQRRVAGIARTLGMPWVTALADPAVPSVVDVVVAWELSWYHFQIDLGDERDPVAMLDKGDELDQIDETLRVWNAAMDDRGMLVTGVASER
jgi:hypothetical protein